MKLSGQPAKLGKDAAYILEHSSTMKDEEIARALSKSLSAVRKMRQRLGIKKACGRGVCRVTVAVG